MANIKLIVGLGNPGTKYDLTRHNAGFWFVGEVSRKYACPLRPESRFQGEAGRCVIDSVDCRLLQPTTFMNLSGRSVSALAGFYKISPEEILVVHDEVDLPPGTVRLKCGGGHGGHNGLRDIIAALGSKNFYRLRIGVGHPGNKDAVVNYVLGKPNAGDRTLIDDSVDAAMEVLEDIVNGDMEKAMRVLHTRA